jgi:hypothetical protein
MLRTLIDVCGKEIVGQGYQRQGVRAARVRTARAKAAGVVLPILIAVGLVSAAIVFQRKVVATGWDSGSNRDGWPADTKAEGNARLDAEKARKAKQPVTAEPGAVVPAASTRR